jgi:hypothetical protein
MGGKDDDAMKKITRAKAIRAKCLDCPKHKYEEAGFGHPQGAHCRGRTAPIPAKALQPGVDGMSRWWPV